MWKPVLALDLGGVLLSDPTRGGFWLEISSGDQQLAFRAKDMWTEILKVPFEIGDLPEDEVWGELSNLTKNSATFIRNSFLSGFQEIEHGVNALRYFADSGAKTVLATNHYAPWLDIWRAKFEWFSLLDEVACSSEMHCRKPEAEYFRLLIDMAGATAESMIFVDDDSENVRAAEVANIRAIYADPSGLWTQTLHKSEGNM
ncbi:HAD hydrolase-like protein [Gordonia rubripertincta]|uniref:HAD hydrolase-like protein n=2 Tax=Gordonia rubripertincta TaxID=36822 RepID=A0AAW6RF55_GORRU|nr:HAD hydrolase-like protein [Gordonia rubripertincta]MDG6782715.1 HAD hydrolase-like protein [Gordonia rubripertincta]NKY62026.1 HAD hydrolase-like protein [Gordonia rubripertincta]GAB86829.1 hypothetical protein GORBP_081_01120 [Gordonia rubripertincta NBRC 101908]